MRLMWSQLSEYGLTSGKLFLLLLFFFFQFSFQTHDYIPKTVYRKWIRLTAFSQGPQNKFSEMDVRSHNNINRVSMTEKGQATQHTWSFISILGDDFEGDWERTWGSFYLSIFLILYLSHISLNSLKNRLPNYDP